MIRSLAIAFGIREIYVVRCRLRRLEADHRRELAARWCDGFRAALALNEGER